MFKINEINISQFHSDQRFVVINQHSDKILTARDMFSDAGLLLRPDILLQDETTGLYRPRPDTVLKHLDTNRVDTARNLTEEPLCISSATGFVYPDRDNILFDPGRLRLIVFDEFKTSPTENIWLIPFLQFDQETPVIQNSSQFRLWSDVIDPTTGLRVPIMGASLKNGELTPFFRTNPLLHHKFWEYGIFSVRKLISFYREKL